MASELYNTIDAISREKGIDPQIVVSAVEDAIVVASRKYFKSNEELRGRINPDTDQTTVVGMLGGKRVGIDIRARGSACCVRAARTALSPALFPAWPRDAVIPPLKARVPFLSKTTV